MDMIEQPVLKDLPGVTQEKMIQAVNGIMANRTVIKQKLHEKREELGRKALRNSQLAVELLYGKRQ